MIKPMKSSPPHEKTTCGAKTRSGHPCKKPPMANGRCKNHGGKSLKGADSPTFKHGRYSKYMPNELLKVYTETSDDPQLLSLRAEIAMMDALLSTMLPKLGTGESGKAWDTVKKLIKKVRIAYKTENLGTMEDALSEMEDLANHRILHYETEKEIKDTVDQRRKLVETETKISMQNERAIPVEQLMLLMSQVLNVIQSVVTEDKQRYAIAVELQRLISLPAGD